MSKNENVVNHSGRDKYRQLTVSAFAFIKITRNKKQKMVKSTYQFRCPMKRLLVLAQKPTTDPLRPKAR